MYLRIYFFFSGEGSLKICYNLIKEYDPEESSPMAKMGAAASSGKANSKATYAETYANMFKDSGVSFVTFILIYES